MPELTSVKGRAFDSPKRWNREELDKLLAVTESPKYRLIFLVLNSSARPAEVLSMRPSDIFPEERIVRLFTVKKKKGVRWCVGKLNTPPNPGYYTRRYRPARLVPASELLIKTYFEYLGGVLGLKTDVAANDCLLLFPGLNKRGGVYDRHCPLGTRTLNAVLRGLCVKGGIRHLTPKMGRHAFISDLLHGYDGRGGLAASAAIRFSGHSSEGHMRAYDHPPVDDLILHRAYEVLGYGTKITASDSWGFDGYS